MDKLNEILDNYKADLDAALNENERNVRRCLANDIFNEFTNSLKVAVAQKESGDAPVVDLGGKFDFAESRYVRGKNGWLAASLYKKAEEDGLEPFDVPLASIDLNVMPFKCGSFDSFIWHMKLCMNTDTKFPILLDDLGQIADGNHRVARAILEGKKCIKAYRLKSMPPVDFNEEE